MAEPIAAETPAAACAKNDKPKPCCVCTTEKSSRDECLLFNGQESGKCDDLISKYKVCMKGYGFTV
ncbi:cytochrome c oxidase copper chaperone [Trichomonascus vanleenenianus]|uniref:copper metallochaperone COX17 n=1 Tax=Trichomonascus vanleenenianus TaxID=2268995 RepID=UPI003ECA1602